MGVQLSNHRLLRVMDTLQKTEDTIPPGISLIQAPAIWPKTKGRGVVVAVLDTGCDIHHPDLEERIIGGRNFLPGGNPQDISDAHYHGTHVAGTIAASWNGTGIVGVAPEAKLLICKVLDKEGKGSTENIAQAVRWVMDWRGPRGERVGVMNMSFGGPKYDETFHRAVRDAVKSGILVACASGNEGDGTGKVRIAYPGAFPEVVEVGAVDLNKKLAPFSNVNPEMDMVAPGVEIVSTYPGGKYAALSGTSMATPHASGAAALIIAHMAASGKKVTEPAVFYTMMDCTESINLPRNQQGKGLLQLGKLLPPSREREVSPTTYEATIRPVLGGYMVSLGVYRDRQEAEAMLEQLKKDMKKAGLELNYSFRSFFG